MNIIERAERMKDIHSDSRGPLFMEAMKMQEKRFLNIKNQKVLRILNQTMCLLEME